MAPISSRRTFAAIGASGRRGAAGAIRLRFLAAPPDDDLVRVGYAISRKAGNAVMRNRIRRRLRAAVDAVAGEMAPGAYLISPDPSTTDMPFDALIHSLRTCLRAAGATREDPR